MSETQNAKPGTVLVFAGPSGGHLFPALSFAEAWKKQDPSARLFLVTSEKAGPLTKAFTPGIFEDVVYLNNFPSVQGISLRSAGFLLKLARAFGASYRHLTRLKPDLSVGFGSYVSFPGMLLSAWKKIPTVIHEQNAVPGKATQWLAGHADGAAVSFPETLENAKLRRREVTGLPLRSRFYQSLSSPRTAPANGRVKLLIVGGSQGASFLNRTILDAFSLLNSEEKNKIAVTHITGEKDLVSVTETYRKQGLEAKVFPFFEKMESLYPEADLALTRAGANTLFELAMFRVPAVVIPYPHAGGHQADNARYFEKRGAVRVELESSLTPESLAAVLRELVADEDGRRRMSEAMGKLACPEAPEKTTHFALDVFIHKRRAE